MTRRQKPGDTWIPTRFQPDRIVKRRSRPSVVIGSSDRELFTWSEPFGPPVINPRFYRGRPGPILTRGRRWILPVRRRFYWHDPNMWDVLGNPVLDEGFSED